MVCSFVGVIGGGFFLATACFIQADRKRTELYAQGKTFFSSASSAELELMPQGFTMWSEFRAVLQKKTHAA